MTQSRRDFLNQSSIIATSAVAAGMTIPANHSSANDTVRLGIMGVRSRGAQLAKEFSRCKNCQVVVVCDVDERVVPPVQDSVEKMTGKRPRAESDFRKMLEGDEIDALVVAAPDHWHAIATIYACQAGKDVYCEKPASHNLTEGRLMVKAARKYDRVVQLGIQRRSSIAMQKAMKGLSDGLIGDVHMARAWIVSRRPNIGRAPNAPAPKGVDYDLWLGPAPKQEFNPNHFHYEWHWFWDYGTGECGNNGIHALDMARWGLGVEFPKRACAGGAKHFFDDAQQTPDTQIATFEFDDATVTWEHRTWNPQGFDGKAFGVIFYGVDGVLTTDGAGWKAVDFDGEVIEQQDADPGNHYQNFIDCIQSRERPNADIEIGHKSTSLCHIANIAYRTRLNLEFDGEEQRFTGLGADQANKLLWRTYREPFVLTEDV
ncbi:MAG: Gfo/Idh/MocA family oxidoreductase [Candidatus Hinthialibacter antarcticus]|nr:Gfo/Idh/MocA family oxidoreductase [Candidatus Hinthialibacter antarcticus]